MVKRADRALGWRLLFGVASWILGVGVAAVLLAERDPEALFGFYTRWRFAGLAAFAYGFAGAVYVAVGAGSATLRAARFAIASAATLGTVGALETAAALGVSFPRFVEIPVGWGSLDPRWWRLDPDLIHVRYPHLRIEGRSPGDIRNVPPGERHLYEVSASYDRHGFRNEVDLEQAPVVLVGDSFLEAGLVRQRETVQALLQERLGVAVANLGVTMYGPQQELATLRRYGLALRPEVVLWFFFEGNDLENARGYENRRKAVAELLREDYWQRSLLRLVGRRFVRWATPPSTVYAPSCEVSARGSRHRIFFRYFGAGGHDDTEAVGRVEAILLAARDAASAAGTAFAVVYVPTKLRVYRDLCSRGSDANWPDESPDDDFPARMGAWARATGIPFFDLTPDLRAAARDAGLLYFPDDSHWTPEGNRYVAETVAHRVEASGWLASSRRRASHRKTTNLRRRPGRLGRSGPDDPGRMIELGATGAFLANGVRNPRLRRRRTPASDRVCP